MSTDVIHGTGTEEDTFLDIEFRFAEPCFYLDVGCVSEAKWKLTSRCCGGSIHVCQQHFDEQLEFLNEHNVECIWCKTIWIPGTRWILKAEPLDKK